MNFTKYQHVERLGTTETDGILDGDVLVFPKIDGTKRKEWIVYGIIFYYFRCIGKISYPDGFVLWNDYIIKIRWGNNDFPFGFNLFNLSSVCIFSSYIWPDNADLVLDCNFKKYC